MLLLIVFRYIHMNLELSCGWSGRCSDDTYGTTGISTRCETSTQESLYISSKASLNNGSMSPQSLQIKL
jgi:hypothetical protein